MLSVFNHKMTMMIKRSTYIKNLYRKNSFINKDLFKKNRKLINKNYFNYKRMTQI